MASNSYQAQAYSRVWQIQQMLHPKPSDLISASRFFVREGELSMWNQKKRKKSRRYFFLFNDIMLLTKKQSSKKFILRIHITLRSPSVSVEIIDSASFNWEFRLHCKSRSFILYASGEEDRQFWYSDMEKSIKGTHDEEVKTKEKDAKGETKIPTDQVKQPTADLAMRTNVSVSTPSNVAPAGASAGVISTSSKKKIKVKSPDTERNRSVSELPKKSSSTRTAGSVSTLPKKTNSDSIHTKSSPGIIQNDVLVSPVAFESPATGLFVYPSPMTTNNPFLDIPAVNQNPFATNTFTGTNPYATNSPFAPNQARASPFATTPAAFGANNSFGSATFSGFGNTTFGSATLTSSNPNFGSATFSSNPFSTNNPAPVVAVSNPNPFSTNNPNPFAAPAAAAPANPFATNNPNPFATNNPNPFSTSTQSSGGHFF